MEVVFLIAAILSLLNVLMALFTKKIIFASGLVDDYEDKSRFFAGLAAFILFIYFYGGFYFFIFPNS